MPMVYCHIALRFWFCRPCWGSAVRCASATCALCLCGDALALACMRTPDRYVGGEVGKEFDPLSLKYAPAPPPLGCAARQVLVY